VTFANFVIVCSVGSDNYCKGGGVQLMGAIFCDGAHGGRLAMRSNQPIAQGGSRIAIFLWEISSYV